MLHQVACLAPLGTCDAAGRPIHRTPAHLATAATTCSSGEAALFFSSYQKVHNQLGRYACADDLERGAVCLPKRAIGNACRGHLMRYRERSFVVALPNLLKGSCESRQVLQPFDWPGYPANSGFTANLGNLIYYHPSATPSVRYHDAFAQFDLVMRHLNPLVSENADERRAMLSAVQPLAPSGCMRRAWAVPHSSVVSCTTSNPASRICAAVAVPIVSEAS